VAGDSEQHTPTSHPSNPTATSSPVLNGDTPDERFDSWLDTGGKEEFYGLWSSGQLSDAPPAGISEEQKRRLFEAWVEANLDGIRSAWNRASVLRAQADLRTALVVALVFYTEHETFDGFSPREGERIDRSLNLTNSNIRFGAVSVGEADRTSIVFTTESASGAVLCIARIISEEDPQLGMTDARTAAECKGGGWIEPDGAIQGL
jgi:hypothetical protein